MRTATRRWLEKRGQDARGAALLVVPGLLVFLQLHVWDVRGPGWLATNFDPDYLYLSCSVDLLDRKAPHYADHPGTPPQLFGALVLRLIHGSDRGSWERDAPYEAETWLLEIRGAIFLMNVLMVAVAGFAGHRITGRLWPGVLLQAAPLLSISTLEALGTFRPEPFLLIGASLYSLLILAFTHGGLQARARDRASLAWAAISGIAVASKLTFAPLLAVPVALLRGGGARARFFLVASLAFAASTTPVWRELPRVAAFLSRCLTHIGPYGSGGHGFADPGRFALAVFELPAKQPFYCFAVALSLCALAALRLRASPLDEDRDKAMALSGALAAGGCLIALYAKQDFPRYLIAAVGLSGVMLVIAVDVLRERLRTNPRGRRVLTSVVGVMLLYCAWTVGVRQLRSAKNMWRTAANEAAAVDRIVGREYPGYLRIDDLLSSSRASALVFGSRFLTPFYADWPDAFPRLPSNGWVCAAAKTACYGHGGKKASAAKLLRSGKVVFHRRTLRPDLARAHWMNELAPCEPVFRGRADHLCVVR